MLLSYYLLDPRSIRHTRKIVDSSIRYTHSSFIVSFSTTCSTILCGAVSFLSFRIQHKPNKIRRSIQADSSIIYYLLQAKISKMKFTFKKNADSSADGDGNIEQQLLPKSRSFSSKSKTSDDARSMKKSKTMNKKATNDAPHRGGDAGVINVKTAAPVSSKMSAERLAQKARGDSLVHKADATEGKSSWFSFATKESSQKKDNQAVLLLKKAAGAYTLAGCDDEAGKAYQRAADIYKDRLQNKVEASRCLTDAGEVLKKTNSAESTKCYQSAVTLLVEAGKLKEPVSYRSTAY